MTYLILQQEYKKQLKKLNFSEDLAQLDILAYLGTVLDKIAKNRKAWFFKESVLGLYLWGKVGRGKSFIIDLFVYVYKSYGYEDLYHTHFHSFMSFIHSELKKKQGIKNPLNNIVAEFASKYKILCLDEFMVTDIVDAMLLANLLTELFNHKILLITTSNIAPEELYKNGLQRSKFLPVIDLIKNNTKIIELLSDQDYRLRNLENSHVFYFEDNVEIKLKERFESLAVLNVNFDKTITINNREIKTKGFSDKILWLDFAEICQGNRAVSDYIEISKIYSILLVSDIQIMSDKNLAITRRFINLIDELYLFKVKLIANFFIDIEHLYQGQSLSSEFSRTKSRLIEMQSKYYLSLDHGC